MDKLGYEKESSVNKKGRNDREISFSTFAKV